MDPTIITLLITSAMTLLLNIFQSIKSRHFASTCCGSSCMYDEERENLNNK